MRRRSVIARDRIILPLDVSDITAAQALVDKLAPCVGMFKIGLEFIYAIIAGLMTGGDEQAISTLRGVQRLVRGIGEKRVFLDGKLCDIPNTVGMAASATSRMGVAFFNVYASAGLEAIRAAVRVRGESNVLGVTVLTSIGSDECISMFGGEPDKKVFQFASKILEAGADGIICSPKELKLLRADAKFDDMIIITPGVRPVWAPANDQKRVMTPGEAISAGADYLVIGRPITAAHDPVAAAEHIAEEIAEASANL